MAAEPKAKAKTQALLDFFVAQATDDADLCEALAFTINALHAQLQAAQQRDAARRNHWLALSRAGKLIEKK